MLGMIYVLCVESILNIIFPRCQFTNAVSVSLSSGGSNLFSIKSCLRKIAYAFSSNFQLDASVSQIQGL